MSKPVIDECPAALSWPARMERLRRIALALTRSPDDADDLTQQTLVTLLSKRPDRADHLGYARQTMVHLWLDRQRSLRRQLRRTVRLALTRRRSHVDRDWMSATDQYEQARRVIETLPPQQRAAVVLRMVEELGYTEIAEALDCSVQSVRANLHLARQRLRQLIGEPP